VFALHFGSTNQMKMICFHKDKTTDNCSDEIVLC